MDAVLELVAAWLGIGVVARIWVASRTWGLPAYGWTDVLWQIVAWPMLYLYL